MYSNNKLIVLLKMYLNNYGRIFYRVTLLVMQSLVCLAVVVPTKYNHKLKLNQYSHSQRNSKVANKEHALLKLSNSCNVHRTMMTFRCAQDSTKPSDSARKLTVMSNIYFTQP